MLECFLGGQKIEQPGWCFLGEQKTEQPWWCFSGEQKTEAGWCYFFPEQKICFFVIISLADYFLGCISLTPNRLNQQGKNIRYCVYFPTVLNRIS